MLLGIKSQIFTVYTRVVQVEWWLMRYLQKVPFGAQSCCLLLFSSLPFWFFPFFYPFVLIPLLWRDVSAARMVR